MLKLPAKDKFQQQINCCWEILEKHTPIKINKLTQALVFKVKSEKEC